MSNIWSFLGRGRGGNSGAIMILRGAIAASSSTCVTPSVLLVIESV